MSENATQALTVVPQGGALVSVQNFKAKLEQQKQMRSALVAYVKSEMKPRHHFYTLPQAKEGTKPSLSQDGARLLCGIYEVRPAWDILPTYHDDNHISVMVMCRLINIHSEVELASGGGFCTSRERAFARSNIPDEYNNVIKRAQKRAYVDAVLRLPMVSEVFDTGDGDGQGSQVFELVNAWYRGVPKHNKKAAVGFIFHCAPEAIRGLEQTALEAGLAEIERMKAAQIDWDSKTLVDDMRKAKAVSAEKSVADVWGDDPRKPRQEAKPEPVVESDPEEISHVHYWEIHEVSTALLGRLESSAAREDLADATYQLEALLNEEVSEQELIEMQAHIAAAAERVKAAMKAIEGGEARG